MPSTTPSTSKTTTSKKVRHIEQLCLACSCSISSKTPALFQTKCCGRPICAQCLEGNPRLQQYDPCLVCLSGVGAVGSGRGNNSGVRRPNVDGGAHDDGMFVLGDEDESDESDVDEILAEDREHLNPTSSVPSTSLKDALESPESLSEDPTPPDVPEISTPAPAKYYIQRGDTLQGIALRFGLHGRDLCTLNSLPPSTLSTHPHLLHTRTSLILPPSSRALNLPLRPPTPPEVAEMRRQERAGKRMQVVTKEVDWRVAKAYVSLASEHDDEAAAYKIKHKEEGYVRRRDGGVLESRAVERYLEDEEWEAREMREGRMPKLQRFPYAGFEREKSEKRKFW